MVTKKIPALLTASACIALGACSTTDSSTNHSAMRDGTTTSGGMATGRSGTGGIDKSGTSGDSPMAGRTGALTKPPMQDGASATASTASTSATSSASGASMAATSYALVQLIEAMPRTQAMAGATMLPPTAESAGSSGSAGTMTEGGSASDNVYRITLRMDDGSTKAVVMETQPDLQIGDRVRMANGALQRY